MKKKLYNSNKLTSSDSRRFLFGNVHRNLIPKKKSNLIQHRKKKKFSLSVSVRIKPILDLKQYKHNSKRGQKLEKKHLWNRNLICVSGKKFNFSDNIIEPQHDQVVAYENIIPPLLREWEHGFDVCLLLYGQTGSGKTHTIFGKPGTLTTTNFLASSDQGIIHKDWGLFPRSMLRMLERAKNEATISLKVSVIEVYFENVFDILNKKRRLNFGISSKKKLLPNDKPGRTRKYEFFSDRFGRSNRPTKFSKSAIKEKFTFSGHEEIPLENPIEIAKICRLLENTRTARSTDMNDRSSRSHCVVTVTLLKGFGKKIQKSLFYFVDLAGSERIKKSGAEGNRKSEAVNVNTSLSALARTINALSSKRPYIPYRDSTLTMILKDAFGGNCKTHMIVTIAEDSQHGEESLCSLRFGERSAMIENNVSKKKNLNISNSMNSIRIQLRSLMKEKKLLEERGMAGGVDKVNFPPHVVQMWYRNKKLLDDAKKEVEKYQLILAELADVKNSKKYELAKEKLDSASKVVWVQDGIIQRMIFSKLWKKPSPFYKAKCDEIRELKSQLNSFSRISKLK